MYYILISNIIVHTCDSYSRGSN